MKIETLLLTAAKRHNRISQNIGNYHNEIPIKMTKITNRE